MGGSPQAHRAWPVGGECGLSTKRKTHVAIGHELDGSPGDESRLPYSGGAVVNPGKGFNVGGRATRLKGSSAARQESLPQGGKAVCMGLTEILRLRSVPPLNPGAPGVGFRIHEQRKRGMIEE